MYLVVSRWAAKPGMEDEFRARSAPVRAVLRSQPGVKLMESAFDGTTAVAVIGYADEDTYHRIVDDPDGPFCRALAENKLEEAAEWLDSVRGESTSE